MGADEDDCDEDGEMVVAVTVMLMIMMIMLMMMMIMNFNMFLLPINECLLGIIKDISWNYKSVMSVTFPLIDESMVYHMQREWYFLNAEL